MWKIDNVDMMVARIYLYIAILGKEKREERQIKFFSP